MVYFFTGLPFVVVFIAALTVIVWVGFSLSRPELSVFLLLAILVAFSGSSYGQLDAERTIYGRGTGVFYFSIVNLFLWGISIVVVINNAFRHRQYDATPITKYFLALTLLILGNALYAAASDDPALQVISAFSYKGLLNIFNMAAFFYICINVFDTRQEASNLLRFLLAAICMRGMFGIVRWAFFGGDPSNAYDNFEYTGSKLTFFDVNDGFLATIAVFCSAWLLSFHRSFLTHWEKYFLLGLMVLETAIILLSFRRSTLVSMGLVTMVFIAILPARSRIIATVISTGVLFGGTTILSALRLSKVRGTNLDRGFFFDVFGDERSAGPSSRILEYTETWSTLGNYWLFGKGMWGKMESNAAELSYHAGDFGFVHSGFGHILLKGGVFGLTVFIALLVNFGLYYLRARKKMQGELQMLADAGAAGVIFWIPTLLIGTPIIEFRSMMMLGLALALPFIAMRAAGNDKSHAST
jgi:hypothetical protein